MRDEKMPKKRKRKRRIRYDRLFAIFMVLALMIAGVCAFTHKDKLDISDDEVESEDTNELEALEEDKQEYIESPSEEIASVCLNNVIEYSQYPDYPTGCEVTALYILLKYYDVDVTMDELVEALPKGPIPWYDADGVRYGANPARQFVGDPRYSDSYGVFNEPIRETAEEFKTGAIAKTGATLDDIKEIITSGNPVIAWYTTNIEAGIEYRQEWLDYDTGETVTWPAYEHAVVIYGFDELSNIMYRDPSTGSSAAVGWDTFKEAFEELGGMIVYYDE